MKKSLPFLLCLLLCLSLFPAAQAAGVRDLTHQTALAGQLKDLELFLGVGETSEGTIDFALDRALSRAEALTMLVRALGKGSEAAAHAKTHPFTDVPAWADGTVSYAYEAGLSKGVSDTLFGSNDTASAEMYLTFMLRALGYADGDGGDFTWDSPWILAQTCGILPDRVDRKDFLRADAVDVTCAALFASLKGTDTPLHRQLADQGAFTGAAFATAFPQAPAFPVPDSQNAYELALADAIASFSTVSHQLESPYCTVLDGMAPGFAHGALPRLLLVYKPGSAQGAGFTVNVPLPQASATTPARPEDLVLSPDGATLTYACRFPERLVIFEGEPEEQVLHEAGTYQYKLDLSTGEVVLDITPN